MAWTKVCERAKFLWVQLKRFGPELVADLPRLRTTKMAMLHSAGLPSFRRTSGRVWLVIGKLTCTIVSWDLRHGASR